MQLKKRLTALLADALAQKKIGGANLLLVRHGRDVVSLAVGTARADGIPYRRDTILRMYSQTKPLTATTVMILVERGLLDLDTPVADILPEFAHQRMCLPTRATITSDLPDEHACDVSRETSGTGVSPDATEPVKTPLLIRHLLTMTSGLSYPSSTSAAGKASGTIYADLESRIGTDHEMTTRAFARRLGQAPLHFQPGSHWEYGTSADVLGAVVEAVSGERFGDFLRTNVLEPLGMRDTAFWVPAARRDRLADIWENPDNPLLPGDNGKLKFIRVNHLGINYSADHRPAFESGGAGLFSTLDDYARFGRMLLGHGCLDGVRILSPAAVDYMSHDAITPAQHREYEDWQPGCGYNCLMRVVQDPSRANHLCSVGDFGWDGWLGTYFIVMPSADAVMLLGLQRTNTGTVGLTRRLRNVVSAYLSETN